MSSEVDWQRHFRAAFDRPRHSGWSGVTARVDLSGRAHWV